ncbi:uncharacterized protein EV154DRAFT_484947 [Mucor mucedo]|uniref:uncharacterized protein n=1 Tax=Mucor mucedo TaxID=29922 RepID=UPI00221E6D6A|nr:uncharacterized protein EV154DRAFT_484947 [Mucor mucedo]KAI7887568.1 hypothetical protein EV154DRAFT_484947 [Mucor mucedo]
MVLANQNIEAVMDKGYSTFSADPFVITNPMSRKLVKVVSRFAIEMIWKQIQIFKKESLDRCLRPSTHIIYKEEYDQVFSSQRNSNRWDNVVIRKDTVIPLSSVDARWIVGKVAWSNNSNPLHSVHQLLSAEMYTKTNATDTNFHTLRQDIEEVPFEHVRKEKLDVISHMVDRINDNLDISTYNSFFIKIVKTGRILSKGEAVDAKLKKLKQVTFDDSTIIDDSIKLYLFLRCVGMLQFKLKHVTSVTKVLSEGNCVFRSVAASVGRDEVIRIALSLGEELSGDFEKDEGFYMDLLLCCSLWEYQTLLESIWLSEIGKCNKDK